MKIRALLLSCALTALTLPALAQTMPSGGGGSGGGGTPGGAANTVQYNNAGAFGGVGPGTTTTVLHGNASGAPSYGAVALATDVSGILGSANGGAGSVSGIMQANGSGTVAAATFGNGLSYTSPKLSLTNTLNAQTGTSYAVASTDAASIITGKNAGAIGFTIVQANTAGFTSGYGTTLANINAAGGTNLTLTATTSTFGNGLTSIVLAPGQVADIGSDGVNYPFTSVSLPLMAQDTLLGNPNAANYPTAMTLPACASDGAHALTYASHALACTAVSGASGITVGTTTITSGTTTRIPYNNAGVYGEIVGSGWNGTTLTLPPIAPTGNPAIDLSGAANRNINMNATSEIDVGGTAKISFSGGLIDFSATTFWGAAGAALNASTPTATSASVVANGTNNSGLGAASAGVIDLIANSVDVARVTAAGIIYKQTTAPVPTGTGSPTIATGSTDEAGEVTSGTSATSVIITFNLTHTNAPFCVVHSQAQIVSFAYTLSNTAITITQTATTGDKIDYRCTFP